MPNHPVDRQYGQQSMAYSRSGDLSDSVSGGLSIQRQSVEADGRDWQEYLVETRKMLEKRDGLEIISVNPWSPSIP